MVACDSHLPYVRGRWAFDIWLDSCCMVFIFRQDEGECGLFTIHRIGHTTVTADFDIDSIGSLTFTDADS